MQCYDNEERLVRINEVLKIWPVSKSSWWEGVKKGHYPQPIKLGPRTTAWKISDIRALINRKEVESCKN